MLEIGYFNPCRDGADFLPNAVLVRNLGQCVEKIKAKPKIRAGDTESRPKI
ncbi:hypothetical protein HMPREF0542_12209 [Ligilactobacillus ruminis ATCC 25644]|uniref:Uncharacterized protein n=1 Tax=Ligilactobacillus ruminis ATCC 25644 TaxID=525362 RepID=E7FTI1_9LACO|nr:hypothetical protein HMPREF0542_12209 [Ligilactobacillus ruminis ATCC 25644]EGX98228.1 hypothetical protein ANHS_1196 [Ligilactobacillus ruminis ATCC 25644]